MRRNGFLVATTLIDPLALPGMAGPATSGTCAGKGEGKVKDNRITGRSIVSGLCQADRNFTATGK